jgi:S1-C subfamily serine protease
MKKSSFYLIKTGIVIAFIILAHPAFAAPLVKPDPLATAISKALPSVVTIEISKVLSKTEIVYVNPFTNDPNLQAFNIVVPIGSRQIKIEEQVGAGSGFIVSPRGFIVTNKHVVSDPDAKYTVVLADGTRKQGIVYYRNPRTDVAIIKIDGYYSNVAKLNPTTQPKIGTPVIAIGNAYGKQNNAIATGNIIGLNQSVVAYAPGIKESFTGLFQSSAQITPGYSGGPILDYKGNVIGITVAKDNAQRSTSFSIPLFSIIDDIRPYTVI